MPLYDRFPRISLLANTYDESLKIFLSTEKKKKSLSLLLLAKKKHWKLTTLFVPRGLYPADRGIGRQSNCVAIRRVAFERGEEKSGAGEWKGWTVYSEKGGRRERERGRVKVARGRHGRARVLFGLWRE